LFDLSYQTISNKRRPIERGPKKRYAVYRAEHNANFEVRYEEFCRRWCDRHDEPLEDFKIDHDKFPWRMTWELILTTQRMWPYNRALENRHSWYSDEAIATLKENLELGDKILEGRRLGRNKGN